jgi:monoamine oxidase
VSQPVTGIDTDGAGVRVSTADGGQHHADVAVLAVPPSTWARIRIDSSLLPAPLATNPPRMGDAAKYVAHTTSRFWRRAGLAADACADAPLGFVWEPTARNGADTPDRAAVLIGFCGGTPARELAALDASARLNRCRAAVDALLPGFLAMRAGPPAPEPDRFVAWPAERWTLGGYTFPAPGQVTTTARALRTARCASAASIARSPSPATWKVPSGPASGSPTRSADRQPTGRDRVGSSSPSATNSSDAELRQ